MVQPAILFDLDDTLLDTSGQLVLPAHRDAAVAMVQAGLDAEVERVYQARLELARAFPRLDTTQLTLERFGAAHPDILAAGRRAFFERSITHLELEPAVLDLLTDLQARARLFLITQGHPPTQARKVELLGVQGFFESVVYVDPAFGHTKYDAFARLITEHSLEPARCLVVGDRPDGEVAAGSRLGLLTLRIRRGEHAGSSVTSGEEEATLTVDRVEDLLDACVLLLNLRTF